MKCERLIKLIKYWYGQVQDEAMAPARMADFMRAHLADCQICKADPDIAREIKKIVEIILPPAKIPKAVHQEDEPGEEDFEDFAADDGDSEGTGEEDGDEESGDGLGDADPDGSEDDDI